MNAITRKLSFTSALGTATLLACFAATAAAQSPYFPNVTPLYYSPYGQGTYGRYGPVNTLPQAFRTNQPAFMRPNSSLQFNYRTNSPGFYNGPYIQNNGGGGVFHPLGY
jgi:hypothetical protein